MTVADLIAQTVSLANSVAGGAMTTLLLSGGIIGLATYLIRRAVRAAR